MPVVPMNRLAPQATSARGQEPEVDPTMLAMSAAIAHEQGRLFQVMDSDQFRKSDNVEDRTNWTKEQTEAGVRKDEEANREAGEAKDPGDVNRLGAEAGGYTLDRQIIKKWEQRMTR